MNRDAVAECPDAGAMAALVDGRVADTVRDGMLAHMASCARCAGEFQRLSGDWSLAHLADPGLKQAGVDTLALRERLAASPPPATTGGGDEAATAAIPRAAPTIPGIIDLEPIGRGGMGVVYRGRDTRLDRLVAVKVLSAWTPLSHAARQRAEREALMLGRLDHPNVVAIHAAGEVEGTPYLVMEWVAGPSLQKHLAAGRLEPREAARIARDLARALERVHALGMIHRDIKPDNVLMAPQAGGTAVPKLADFGLARPDEGTHQLTQAEDVLGTPAYMAPEQTGLDPSLGEVGPPADIHGLGGVLFAMLTGHAPYEAATALASMQRSLRGEVTAAALAAHAPADLRTIMWKCLEPMPGRRYRSAGELADDLQRFLEGRPVSARPIPLPLRLAKWARRRPVAAAAAGLTATLAIVAIGGTAYHVARLSRANDEITRGRDEARDSLAVAQRSMQRLTSDSIQRMLMRGGALDAGDRDYLRQIRDEFLEWPLGSDPVEALRFRLEGIERVGELFETTNHIEDSLACALAREEIVEALAREPSAAGARDEIDDLRIEALLDQVSYHRALNDRDKSIDAGRRLIRIIESSSPERRAARAVLLAGAKCDLGNNLTRINRDEEGAPLVVEGLAEVRRLREAAPDDGAIVTVELRALFNSAQSSWRMKRHDERRSRLEQVVELCDASLERFPDRRARIAEKYSVALANLANIATENDRWEEALPLVERRLAVCLATMDAEPDAPDAPDARIQTVDAILQIFKVHRGLKRLRDSRPLLAQALPIAERLVDEQPANFAHAHLLARVLHSVAELEKAVGNWEASMRALDRQFALLEPWRPHATQKQNVERQLGLARIMADWVQKKLDAVSAAPALAEE